jgi:hypothetical protein
LLQQTLQRAADGRFAVPVDNKDLVILRQEIREDGRRRDVTLIAAVTLLGGLFWLALDRNPLWPGAVLVLGSLISLWYSRR